MVDAEEDRVAKLLEQKDKAKYERLERRITSNGSNKSGVTSLGFDSPAQKRKGNTTVPDHKQTLVQDGEQHSESNLSNSSAVSRTVLGIDRVGAPVSHVPASPEDATKFAEDTRRNGGHGALSNSSRSDSKLSLGSTQQLGLQRKRKLESVEESSKSLHGNNGSEEPGFEREEDEAIAAKVFFERSPTVWRELSEQLNRCESSIKARYRYLMNEASKIDSLDRQNFALDVLANTTSRGAFNSRSDEINQVAVSSAKHGAHVQHTNSLSATAPSPAKPSVSNSSVKSRSINSPQVSGTTSIKNALKNQPRIKQFFVPVQDAERAAKRFKQEKESSELQNEVQQDAKEAVPEVSAMVPGTPSPPSPKTLQKAESEPCVITTTPARSLSQTSLTRMSSASSTLFRSPIMQRTPRRSPPRSPTVPQTGESRDLALALRGKNRQIEELERKLDAKDDEVSRERNCLRIANEENTRLKQKCQELEEGASRRNVLVAKVLEELIRNSDSELNKYERKRIAEESFRLGRIVVQKHGVGPHARLAEMWEDGDSFRSIRLRQAELLERREELDKRKRLMVKAIRQRRSKNNNSSSGPEKATLEEVEEDEAIKAEFANLKRRETELSEERIKLEQEKIFFVKSIKRQNEADSSRFNRQPVLNNRYLLREMLGKGGFSEVWKGYDLIELRDVAVKIHELNSNWSEQKKSSYLRHATREYNIHLSLVHPRIVQLYDVFEIDNNSFATVLEFCKGTDLDLHLKWRKSLPEREARAVLLQILSGLRYLSSGGELGTQDDSMSDASDSPNAHAGNNNLRQGRSKSRPCIIHYDLKPGNILLDGSGGVKITDFGLSKIMEPADTESTGIELTSQGAGTYWYLPPECFRVGSAPPKISSKVDVWSCGVILFEMLYGSRPFGQGLSQDVLLKSQTMLKATHVDFPEKPVVSDEAKAFIRRCLTYNQELRPDVAALCEDPYLRQKKL